MQNTIYHWIPVSLLGAGINLSVLDIFGIVAFFIIFLMYIVSFLSDARGYARMDPPKK